MKITKKSPVFVLVGLVIACIAITLSLFVPNLWEFLP